MTCYGQTFLLFRHPDSSASTDLISSELVAKPLACCHLDVENLLFLFLLDVWLGVRWVSFLPKSTSSRLTLRRHPIGRHHERNGEIYSAFMRSG